jgi:hypothetical protein
MTPHRRCAACPYAGTRKRSGINPNCFDQLSKRFAAHGLSRPQTRRQLTAAGLAGALCAWRREAAGADCPDITSCIGPCGPDYLCRPSRFALPGGPVGACWEGFLGCDPCSTTWEALHAKCNQANPQGRGVCKATFPF